MYWILALAVCATQSPGQTPDAERQPAAMLRIASAVYTGDAFSAIPGFGRQGSRRFSDQDGLPQNAINDLAFDAQGYLWAATQAGAARYNGHEWVVVDMPDRMRSNYIRALDVAPNGDIWFATQNSGVVRLAGRSWTTYDTTSGVPNDRVVCLAIEPETNGVSRVWVGTSSGVAYCDGERWRVPESVPAALSEASIQSIFTTDALDGVRQIWVGTTDAVFRYAHGEWTRFDAKDGVPAGRVYTIATDSESPQRLWLGSEQGLAWFDGTRWHGVPDAPKSLAGVRAIVETRDSRGSLVFWVGTENGVFWRSHGVWGKVSETDVPGQTDLMCLLPSRRGDGGTTDGALWVGTNGLGLIRLNPLLWTGFGPEQGLPRSPVRSFCETVDASGARTMWIGKIPGLVKFESGRWVAVASPPGLQKSAVLSLAATRVSPDAPETLWVGTDRIGLLKYELGVWSNPVPSELGTLGGIRCLLTTAGPDGAFDSLWIGSGTSGVVRYRRGEWTVLDSSTGLPMNDIRGLYETENPDGSHSLWVGTNGAGLARRDNDQWVVYNSSNGLPNDMVRGMHEQRTADGRRLLWVGTFGGVGILDLDHPENGWTTLSDRSVPALPDNTIYQVQEDPLGRIYLFTNKGVARMTPREPTEDDPAGYTVRTFTSDHGLPSAECNGGAAFVDSLGRIWAGTVTGAAVLDSSTETVDRTPKPLYIEQVAVSDTGGSFENGATLSHDENHLDFTFALLSFVREQGTRYRTQLVGFDERPSAWTADPHRNYTNLPKGEYTFQVWGRDADGNITGPVSMSFRIAPAPWRTWWAYALYVGLAFLTIAGAFRWRTSRLRRRSLELEATVADRTSELATMVGQLRRSEQHANEAREEAQRANNAKSVFLANMSHELRTPLNAVLGFAQLMERDHRIPVDQREYLDIIQRAGEHLLGLINDVLSLSKIEAGQFTLDTAPFHLGKLLDAVREMIRIRCDAKALALEFEVDGTSTTVLGDERKLRQVLLNLLGNAVKFTAEGRIVLRVRWSDDRAIFEVEDTGAGIAPTELDRLFQPFSQTESGRRSAEGTGLGLAISRQIVHLMGGDIAVRSTLGLGTVFSFDVELPQSAGSAETRSANRVIGVAPGQAVPRVLVVDDARQNRLLVVRLLSAVGIDVKEAGNGAEAVRLFQAWRPDLIFMDMRMPVMNGHEAIRRIRQIEREHDTPVRIVAVTASVFESERDQILSEGADDLIFKPFRHEAIFNKLTQCLGVAFVYESDDESDEPSPPADQTGTLTAERLAGLPEDLRRSLAEALELGDQAEALDLVDRARELDPALGRALGDALRSYKGDEILAALDKG